MPFLNYHDPVLFKDFLTQAVAPVVSARKTGILLHVFVNIEHPIRTHTSFSTFVGQKHVELRAQRIAFQYF